MTFDLLELADLYCGAVEDGQVVITPPDPTNPLDLDVVIGVTELIAEEDTPIGRLLRAAPDRRSRVVWALALGTLGHTMAQGGHDAEQVEGVVIAAYANTPEVNLPGLAEAAAPMVGET